MALNSGAVLISKFEFEKWNRITVAPLSANDLAVGEVHITKITQNGQSRFSN